LVGPTVLLGNRSNISSIQQEEDWLEDRPGHTEVEQDVGPGTLQPELSCPNQERSNMPTDLKTLLSLKLES